MSQRRARGSTDQGRARRMRNPGGAKGSESNVGVMSPEGPGGAGGLELLGSKSEDHG